MPLESLVSFFGGLLTKVAPHLLGPHEAVLAENCVLETGQITPLKASALAATVDTGTTSIYKWGSTWQSSTTNRWYAEAGLYLYWADGGIPQKLKSGGGQSRLGIVAPASAPGFDATPSGHGQILDRSKFAITFYSDPLLTGGTGAESAPILVESVTPAAKITAITVSMPMDSVSSTATEFKVSSDPLAAGFNEFGGYVQVDLGFGHRERLRYSGTRYDGTDYYFTGCLRGQLGTTARDISGGTVYAYGASELALTGIPTSTDAQVNARRIYKLSGGEYVLVDQIDDNTTTTLAATPMQDGDLAGNAILTADNHDTPPNLTGLCGPYNGMLFGWLDKTLRWTKVADYDAWPEDYAFDDFPTEIAAVSTFGGYVVVLTQDGVYTVSGSDPESMVRHKSMSTQGCVYGLTAVDAGPGLVYLSPEGVCLFDGVASRVISDPKLKRSTFSTMTNPKAAFHDGHYLLFFDSNEDYPAGGCLIGDLRGAEPIWRTATETARSVFRSDADDALYLGMADGSSINEWEAGDDLPWRYWTGELAFGSLMAEKLLYNATLDCSGDVQVEVWIDGQRRHLKLVESPTRPYRMRMAGTCRGRKIQIRLSGAGTVNSLEFDHSGPRRAR